MVGYNPDYIELPATIDEARVMAADELRDLLDDPEVAPYILLFALPAPGEWFDSGAEGLESYLAA
jgi:hypothetical protein